MGQVASNVFDVVGTPGTQQLLNNPNIWIGDTGATTDLTTYANGLAEIRKGTGSTQMGVGTLIISKIGKLRGDVFDESGNSN